MRGQNIDSCMKNYIDVFIKAGEYGIYGREAEYAAACKLIAFIVGYDYTKLNAALLHPVIDRWDKGWESHTSVSLPCVKGGGTAEP